MKRKEIELDVDFIGEQESTLTKEEEKKISEFIKRNKQKHFKSKKNKKLPV